MNVDWEKIEFQSKQDEKMKKMVLFEIVLMDFIIGTLDQRIKRHVAHTSVFLLIVTVANTMHEQI